MPDSMSCHMSMHLFKSAAEEIYAECPFFKINTILSLKKRECFSLSNTFPISIYLPALISRLTLALVEFSHAACDFLCSRRAHHPLPNKGSRVSKSEESDVVPIKSVHPPSCL
jgi:hypothetical protein